MSLTPESKTAWPANSPMVDWMPAFVAGGLCLALGLATVIWRANVNTAATRSRAQIEAMAWGAIIELELQKVLKAAESLGLVARQNNPAGLNFQKIAAELLSSNPELASLELQPGGIVSETLPRSAQARRVGFNVLKDPAYRGAAVEASQRRKSALAAPLPLHDGLPGFVALVPIFHQTSDGQEQFWGFVAASMHLKGVLDRAHLQDLSKRGYNYVLFAPGHQAGKAILLSRSGAVIGKDVIQQTIRTQNMELGLAVQPKNGWVNWPEALLGSGGVLLASGLIGLVVQGISRNRVLKSKFVESNQLLSNETLDRKRAQDELARVKSRVEIGQRDAKEAQNGLEKAREESAHRRTEFDAALAREASAKDAQEKAEEKASLLQSMLDRSASAAAPEKQANQAELASTRTKIHEVEQIIQELRQTAAALEKERSQQQVVIGDLQAQLHTQSMEAKAAGRANAARLQEAERINEELKISLASAELEQGKMAELSERLRQAESTLQQFEETSGGRATTEQDHAIPTDASKVEVPPPKLTEEPLAAASSESEPPVQPPEPMTGPPRTTRREEVLPSTPAKKESATKTARVEPGRAGRGRGKRRDEAQIELFGESNSETLAENASDEDLRAASSETTIRSRETPSNVEPVLGLEEAAESSIPDQEATGTGRDDVATKPKVSRSTEERVVPVRRPAPLPPVDPAELRRVVSQILPLLMEMDPGAKDCFKANRAAFRSAFSVAGFEEFEQQVKSGSFESALEHLRKVARRHGINV